MNQLDLCSETSVKMRLHHKSQSQLQGDPQLLKRQLLTAPPLVLRARNLAPLLKVPARR